MPLGPPQLPPDPPAVVEPVAAQEPDTATVGGLEFGWTAPENCGSAEGLATQVERYLAESGSHTLRIDATADARDAG